MRVDEQIDPVAGSEPHAAVACEKWLCGLAVDRHHPDRVSIEPDEEAACRGGVDDPQPQALAGFHRDIGTDGAVHEHRRTVGRSRCGEQERDVAIDVDRRVLDDERAGEPAIGLAGNICVVPERAGVGRPEAVIEARAGCYRRLGQLRYAVHGIGQPDAVPMHAGRRGEIVDQPHAKLVTAPDPQCRPRRDAVIAQACMTQACRWQRAGAQQAETVGGGLRGRAGWQSGTGDRRSRADEPSARYRLRSRCHRFAFGADQFTLMPAALTSSVLVSISRFTRASNSAEVSAIGSAPRPASFSRTAGVCRAFAISE